MAKKNATNAKSVQPIEVQIVEAIEKFEQETPTLQEDKTPSVLTAEEILEKELERLKMRSDLAKKRKGFLKILQDLQKVGEDIGKLQEGDEFEARNYSLTFNYGYNSEIQITNVFVLDSFLMFIEQNLSEKVGRLGTEILNS